MYNGAKDSCFMFLGKMCALGLFFDSFLWAILLNLSFLLARKQAVLFWCHWLFLISSRDLPSLCKIDAFRLISPKDNQFFFVFGITDCFSPVFRFQFIFCQLFAFLGVVAFLTVSCYVAVLSGFPL